MKIVAIYGSGRMKGFSSTAVDESVKHFDTPQNEIKKYYLSRMNYSGCIGCFSCRTQSNCVLQDDMTELLNDIITCDFVIFSSPIYCFDLNGNYKKMFERFYPLLEGNKGAAGIPEKRTLKLPYTCRYPRKKCMLILSAGAASIMCHSARRRAERLLNFNGFKHIGTVVIDGTYANQQVSLTDNQKWKISNICSKII